jgi:hypothetical protein
MPLPIPKAFWPFTVVAGVNDRIDFKVGANTYVATITPGTYTHPFWFAGDLETSLASAIVFALSAAYGAVDWFSGPAPGGAPGRFLISNVQNVPVQLLGATGANVARSALGWIGWGAVDGGFNVQNIVPSQHANGWYAEDPVEDDTDELPSWNRAQTRALGGAVKSVQFGGTLYERSIALGFLQPYKVFKNAEGAQHANEALERLIESGWSRFRWWPDGSAEATYGDYVLDLDTAKRLLRNRLSPGAAFYSYPLRFLKFV